MLLLLLGILFLVLAALPAFSGDGGEGRFALFDRGVLLRVWLSIAVFGLLPRTLFATLLSFFATCWRRLL